MPRCVNVSVLGRTLITPLNQFRQQGVGLNVFVILYVWVYIYIRLQMSGNIETISLWAYLSSDSTQTILDKLCLYGFPTSGSYKS